MSIYNADCIYTECNEKEIKELLLYRKIVKADNDILYSEVNNNVT